MTASSSSSASDAKRFIPPTLLHTLSEELAFKVAEAKYRPTFLIAIWRGGCYAGAIVQEILEHVYDDVIDHVAIRTVSRDPASGRALPDIIVRATGHLQAALTADDRLLIVDDVFDSGRSIKAVMDHLANTLKERMPREVKVATLFYKPKRNKTDRVPDFYVEETDAWLVFSHELAELSPEEVAEFRPNVFQKAGELHALWNSSADLV
jgi:hypoxanthine phosphoribosyltransferase